MESKKTIIFVVMSVLLLSGSIIAQQPSIDSLKKRLIQTDDLRQRAEIFAQLATCSRNYNPYAGLNYTDSALMLAESLKDQRFEARVINESGVLYRKIDMYEMALSQHQTALQMFEQLNDTMGIAFVYSNLGTLFLVLQDYQKARQYHLDALRLKLALSDSLQMAFSYRAVALAYQAMQQPDSARLLLDQALAIYKSKNDELGQANVYYRLGNLLIETGSAPDLALHYYARGLDIYSKFQSQYGSATSSYEMGKVYTQLGKNDLARKYFEDALRMAKNAKIQSTMMDAYLALSLLSNNVGKYREAFDFYRSYSALRDSLFSERTEKGIAEMQSKYQHDKQQSEILLLRQQNQLMLKEQKLNDAYLLILAIGILSVFIISVISYFRYREKKKANLQLKAEVQQRKENEQKLEASQKELQHANATKDKFFSIISHDLKGPFNGIMGFAELLETDYDYLSDEERKEMIHEIRKASDNTFLLLEDLLTWSRSQRGLIIYKPEAVRLINLFHYTLEITSSAARRKKVRIDLKVDEKIIVCADQNMLTTILRNLISNAIKYSQQGGTIVVSARLNNYDETNPPQQFVEISVADNGVGISIENINRLFRIEEKAHTKGTANEAGTGLGLVICKEFVEIHGGAINVDSTLGKGSTFTFTIPAADATILASLESQDLKKVKTALQSN
jgi:signal transduction histidine kinase